MNENIEIDKFNYKEIGNNTYYGMFIILLGFIMGIKFQGVGDIFFVISVILGMSAYVFG